nr:flagellar basal-body MS-ring/collar protein FliF [Photobacterium galatheae]
MNKKVLLGGALAVGIAVSGYTFHQLSQPSYVTMMTNLDQTSLQTIIPVLEAEGIPFTVAPNNATLLVDRDALQKATNILAKHGLPSKPATGYDHLSNSNSPYMTKSTEEQISRQILEENLESSILQLDSVHKAQVRLAVAKNSQFLRDVEPSSASVVLTLKRGQSLNRSQINGIVKMIAYSVPNLPEENVIILDHTGRSLSKGNDASLGNGGTASEHKLLIEEQLRQKVVEVVAPIVGLEQVRVNVEAKVNFDKVENTKEEPVPSSVILSQQSEKSYDPELAGGEGVVGAVANQPPQHASFADKPDSMANQQQSSGIRHLKETTNYSVGKSITHTIQSSGRVEKVNVAILFDRTQFSEEALPKIMETITSLAQSSIGFDADRGDSIDVRAMVFSEPEVIEAEPVPFYETQIAKDAMAAGKWIGAILLLWLLFWRPLMQRILPGSSAKEENPDQVPDLTADDNHVQNQALSLSEQLSTEATEAEFSREMTKAIELMKTKPTEAQNVLQSWLLEISLENLLGSEEENEAHEMNSEQAESKTDESDVGENNEK